MHLREYQPPMFLPFGVTTIADIHNDTAWSIAQREALRSGQIQGPRLFVSGARVTGPNGGPTDDAGYVRDVAEARAYVRSLKEAGVDQIKVDLTITDEQLQAVIEEATALGLKVLGHTQNIKKAADIGMKYMEHLDTMARALLEQEGKDPRPAGTTSEAAVDPALFPPLFDYLVQEGVYVNPVLILSWKGATERWRDWTRDAREMVEDPDLAFVPEDVKAAWLREPRQARAWAAEVIGQDRDLGSVEPGKLADFTIVAGNPLTDISATRDVSMVIKDGQVMDTSYDPSWVNPIPRNLGSTPKRTR